MSDNADKIMCRMCRILPPTDVDRTACGRVQVNLEIFGYVQEVVRMGL